jgi:acetyl esterase/lipase
MTSFKASFINFLMRNRHIINGRFRKEVYTMESSIQKFRDECEAGAARYAKIPDGVTVKPEQIEGINSEWICPQAAKQEKIIMYVHGGGYVSGSCNDHRGFVSKFAKTMGYNCLTYEYRLAPENKFPAAVEDSLIIYKYLLDNGFSSENILIAGESAGGGLTLCLLLAIKEKGLSQPVAAVAISPWADLTCSGESYKTKGKFSLAPTDSWTVFSKHYVGDGDPHNPLISPVFGELSGLPPIYINSGTADELYDDGRLFAEKAKHLGVDITFVSGENMVHCYPLLAPMFREATEAMEEIKVFVRKWLK